MSTGNAIGTLVRTIRVEGYDLVVERCTIYVGPSVDDCRLSRQPLPATRPPPVPDTLSQRAIALGLDPLREAVRACGTLADLHGVMAVRLEVGPGGNVVDVEPTGELGREGGAALELCILRAVLPARLGESARGGHAILSFRIGGAPDGETPKPPT